MLDIQSNNKRIAKNTLFLYMRMIMQLAIGLYTSRVVLHALGVNDYGIYNVIGGVVAIFSFINGSMSTATNRYLSFELGSKDSDKTRMRQVFCTAEIIHIVIAIIFVLISEVVGILYIRNVMVLPDERIYASLWLLQFSLFTSLIQIISVPYNAAIIAHERMSAFAYIAILEAVFQLSIAILVDDTYIFDRLILYGLLQMISQLIIRVIYGLYCNRHFEETKGKWLFDKKLSTEISKFAMWIMNGSLAVVGYTQGLNLLLNFFFGPAVNAARGLAVTVQTKMSGFCSNFQMAVKPQITKQYAAGSYSYMHTLVYNSSVYSVLLMFFLSFPLMLESSFVLRIWLGEVPEYTQDFVILTLCVSIIESLRDPINTCIHATGNIKKFQLIEGTLSLLVLPLAYVALWAGYGPVSVFVVQFIIFVLLQVVRVFLVCPAISMRKRDYFNNIVIKSLFVIIPSVIIVVPLKFLLNGTNEVVEFFIVGFSSCLCVLGLTYFLVLSKDDKKKLMAYCKNHIFKYNCMKL